MSKRAEAAAEALYHYGASPEAVIEAARCINAGDTEVARVVHEAAHAAWQKHEKAYGFLARFTPRGAALHELKALPVIAEQERRARPDTKPPQRPVLSLPKARANAQPSPSKKGSAGG